MPGKILAEKRTAEKSASDLIVICDQYLDSLMDPTSHSPSFTIRSGVLEEASWMQAKALLMIAQELSLINERNSNVR